MATAYSTAFRLPMTFICLDDTQALGDDDLGTLIDGCPALRYLFLDDCHAITGEARSVNARRGTAQLGRTPLRIITPSCC